MDRNLNHHFFEVCYSAQAIGTSVSHEISHMHRRYSVEPGGSAKSDWETGSEQKGVSGEAGSE